MSNLSSTQIAALNAAYDRTGSVRAAARETGVPYGRARGYFSKATRPRISEPPPGPAILIYDIETAPALAWMWSAYNANIVDIEQDWYMLSFAYKWYGSNEIRFVSIADSPGFKPDSNDDRWVVEHLHQAFDRADMIVAHNGDRFDKKKANARFLYHDMPPPSPYKSFDTVKVMRRFAANTKNNLGELGKLYGIGEKVPHEGFSLWRECMRGDAAAWKRMRAYNLQDVALLERLYEKLRPWAGHPGTATSLNLNQFSDLSVCPKCGADDLIKRGRHRTGSNVYQTYQCKSCGGYSRARSKSADSHGPV